jgi:hypothetical protein
MAKFIKHSQYIERVTYMLAFDYVGERGAGFWFECDESGKVVLGTCASRENYEKCVANCHDKPVIKVGVVALRNSYREPAVIECSDCQQPVALCSSWANTCGCGAFYNGFGQRLVGPSTSDEEPFVWGEETGERFDDNGNPIP